MSTDSLSDEEVLLPCEFCELLCPLEELIEHQSFCRSDLLHFPSVDNSVNIEDTNQNELDLAIAKSIDDVTDHILQQDIFEQKNNENITSVPSTSGEQKKSFCRPDLLHFASVENSVNIEDSNQKELDLAIAKSIDDATDLILQQDISEQKSNKNITSVSSASRESKKVSASVKFSTFDLETVPLENDDTNSKIILHNEAESLNPDHEKEEPQPENDYKLSDDDDDDYNETIESFLKKAAIALKKRAENIKSSKFQNEDVQKGKDSYRFKWSRDADTVQNKHYQKGSDSSQFKWRRST